MKPNKHKSSSLIFERIVYHKLPAGAKNIFLKRVTPIIFDYWPVIIDLMLSNYFIHADQSISLIATDDRDQVKGIHAVSTNYRQIDNKKVCIIRGLLALSEGLRKTHLEVFYRDSAKEVILLAIKASLRGYSVWFADDACTPASYCYVAKIFPRIYPSALKKHQESQYLQSWHAKLAKAENVILEGADLYTERLESGYKVTVEQRNFWANQEDKHVQFFLKACPKWGKGQDLFLVAPLSVKDLIALVVKLIYSSLKNKL